MELKSSDKKPIESIRERTRAQHDRVEQIIGSNHLENDTIDENDISKLLEQYYGLFKSLENHLLPLDLPCFEEFSYESRTKRLQTDLNTLGLSQTDIESLPRIAPEKVKTFHNSHEIMGCLYVIEGSEHGNTVIHKQIKDSLGEDDFKADNFFHGDHDRMRDRWNQFMDDFNRCITSETSLESATAGAKQTFDLFADWFS